MLADWTTAFLGQAFQTDRFIPHGHCYLWQPHLVALHAIADAVIAIAYYSIPLILLYFVRERQDLPFARIFILFSAFIIACGTTHILEVWTLWFPIYWFSGGVKAVTAIVSAYTAIELIPIIPFALALRSPQELEIKNQALEREIQQRQSTESMLRQSEAALRDSEQRYRTLIEAIPQMVWVAEQDGLNTVDFNQRWFEFTGQTLEQSIREGWIAAIHPDDRAIIASRWEQAIASQTSYEAEYRIRRADGVYIWHLAKASPIRHPNGQMIRWYGTCTDISERKQAEDLRERQMIELQRLNLMKDDFLSTVSHELRTPLTNIKMATQLLEIILHRQGLLGSDANPEGTQLDRYFTILNSQCQQELELINDLLDLQRINAGAYDLELTRITLQDWLPSLLSNFQERAANQHQHLQVVMPPELPPLISDELALRRIISELLNNACKYTPADEVIVIEVQQQQDKQIQIRVTNSGVEIPVDEQSRIFEPFYRIPRSDRHGHGGTGLGLALVKKLVMSLGGTIQVQSYSGQTCFVVNLISHDVSAQSTPLST